MDKMQIYEAVRDVPETAKKTIGGGRLKGMTDINPMWRIKRLTELFGACGDGWYTQIIDKQIVPCGDEVVVFVEMELRVLIDGEWSMPISGTGGSHLSSVEKGGLFVNDEAMKMAETDALSVCCKKLGMGADVYWSKDNETKYSVAKPEKIEHLPKCEKCGKVIVGTTGNDDKFITAEEVIRLSQEKTGHTYCAEHLKEAMKK